MKEDISIVVRATNFAAQKHRGQTRKDAVGTPYINHPIALTELLVNIGKVTDRNVLAAALLHDTVEDTDATLEEIEENFGEIICGIVREVTDDKSLPSPERKRLQIENAGKISFEAKLVKLADKISNLQDMIARPPVNWSLQRRQEYFEWAKAVIDNLRGTNEALEKLFDETYANKP